MIQQYKSPQNSLNSTTQINKERVNLVIFKKLVLEVLDRVEPTVLPGLFLGDLLLVLVDVPGVHLSLVGIDLFVTLTV
jgi:hypothetical protein